MKRILCFLLVVCMSVYMFGCTNKQNADNSSEVGIFASEEEKYNTAVSHIKNKNYKGAIILLETIPDYKDANSLLGKVHYVYGSELFNNKDFQGAYEHFLNASEFADISEKQAMVNYYGGVYFANNDNCVTALDFFKRTQGTKFEEQAKPHAISIQDQLLSGVWKGSFTTNTGGTLQIEFGYSMSTNKCNIGFADKSGGGYKLVKEINGKIEFGLNESVYIENAYSKFKISFIFSSIDNMRIVAQGSLGELLNSTYKKVKSWEPTCKIAVTYPTMTVPTLFETSEPTDSTTPTVDLEAEKNSIENIFKAAKGDTVNFGTYEQDSNTNTVDDICWLVLDKTETEMFLVSKDCLKYSRYSNDTNVWEKSYIRSWLNSEFINDAFTDFEKGYIKNDEILTNGMKTTDKIYLLSAEEAGKYFADDISRAIEATKYAYEESFSDSKLEFNEMKNNGWWLRDKSNNTNEVSVCTVSGKDGVIDKKYGMFPANDWLLVRPALKISLNSKDDQQTSGSTSSSQLAPTSQTSATSKINTSSKSPATSQKTTSSKTSAPTTTSNQVVTSSKPVTSAQNLPNNKQDNISSESEHFHDFTIKATCEEPAKCQCGQTSGIANGHLWEEATCTTPKKCEVCNKTEGQALGHKYNSDKTVVCQECEEFRANAGSLIKSIPIKILKPDNTYIVTQSINSAVITNYYNPSEKYFEIEIKVNGKYLLTFNGGGCTFYAFDKSNNKIATQRINTGGGSEGSEFTCNATLTLPINIDGITLAVE